MNEDEYKINPVLRIRVRYPLMPNQENMKFFLKIKPVESLQEIPENTQNFQKDEL